MSEREYAQLFREATEAVNAQAAKAKAYYDRDREALQLQPGEKVYVFNDEAGTFQPRWLGPFAVVEHTSDVNVRLREVEGGPRLGRMHPILHVQRLKRYQGRSQLPPEPQARHERPILLRDEPAKQRDGDTPSDSEDEEEEEGVADGDAELGGDEEDEERADAELLDDFRVEVPLLDPEEDHGRDDDQAQAVRGERAEPQMAPRPARYGLRPRRGRRGSGVVGDSPYL